MNAMGRTVKKILHDEGETKPPKGKALKALQDALVAVLVKMEKADRIEATKVLAMHLVKYWKGEGDRKAVVKVIRAFGKTEEYREVYRLVIPCEAWRRFSREFLADLDSTK